MNNVTFPLKPQMSGPDVANLQEVLGLLLERGAVLGDDEGARRELATALKREQEAQSFGDATRKLVGIFQKARSIEDSGVVDSETADALNALLREWGLLDQLNDGGSTQRLEGRVVFEHGLPAEKLTLRLYRRDFGGSATKLSETSTVAGGRYALAYDSAGKALSLEVRAVDGAGKEIPLSRPVNDLPGEARRALNLAAPATLQPLAPEYQRLMEDVKPLVGDLEKLAEAKENADRQDLTVLNRATGWDARLLACATMAQRLSADGDVRLSGEGLYGLLRAGLPSDKLLLAHVAPEVVERALETVRDAGIVALDDQAVDQFRQQFTTFANEVRLSIAVPGSRSTYSEMLEVSGLDDQDQAKFATAFLGHRGSPAELWQRARQAGLDEVKVRKLQLQGKVSFLTGSSDKLTARVHQALDKSDAAQLVHKDLDRAGSWMRSTPLPGSPRIAATTSTTPTRRSSKP